MPRVLYIPGYFNNTTPFGHTAVDVYAACCLLVHKTDSSSTYIQQWVLGSTSHKNRYTADASVKGLEVGYIGTGSCVVRARKPYIDDPGTHELFPSKNI